jgi:S-adenosyl methyltransferase
MTGNGAPAFDTSVAHQARIYDYLLGGKDNYAADRAAAEAVLTIYPEMAFNARANRAFLGRAVRYLAGEAGIRQFLDIGTGIPTAGNTHQVPQQIAPESRVVYVDYDPIVLAHARALLTSGGAGATDYIHADLCDTGAILGRAAQLLDFGKPVVAADLIDLETRHGLGTLADQMIQQDFTFRGGEQVAQFFASTDPVAPGLVRLEEWRPEPGDPAGTSGMWGAVGRKR